MDDRRLMTNQNGICNSERRRGGNRACSRTKMCEGVSCNRNTRIRMVFQSPDIEKLENDLNSLQLYFIFLLTTRTDKNRTSRS